MTPDDVLALVARMRKAQKRYFGHGRTDAQLADAKALEAAVDKALADHARGPALFAEDPADPLAPVLAAFLAGGPGRVARLALSPAGWWVKLLAGAGREVTAGDHTGRLNARSADRVHVANARNPAAVARAAAAKWADLYPDAPTEEPL